MTFRDPAGHVQVETPSPEVHTLLTGHERRDASWCWRPRGTPTALLVHTRAGRATARVGVGDGEVEISAGDTVVWAPGVPHDFGVRPVAATWEIVWAHFRPDETGPGWLDWAPLGAGIAWVPSPPALLRRRVDDALIEMDSLARSPVPRSIDLAVNALERALLWLATTTRDDHGLDDRVREAVLFIARHLDRPLDVSAIARAVHLSPSRLAHLFTEALGMPPARFVEARRMERAQSLLESTSMSVGAVARASGFSSQPYFTTRFTTYAGLSPGAWRERARSNAVERASTSSAGPDSRHS